MLNHVILKFKLSPGLIAIAAKAHESKKQPTPSIPKWTHAHPNSWRTISSTMHGVITGMHTYISRYNTFPISSNTQPLLTLALSL